jgi:hypothetical protein
MKFEYKKRGTTLKEFAHTDVKADGVYIGYIIDNAVIHGKYWDNILPDEKRWAFVSRNPDFKSEFAATEVELIKIITTEK